MRKMMDRNRKRKGFTLAEVLVVVAIIAILASLSFVAVAKYKRDLASLEMDASAKELFISAQNHLSLAESQALLDRDTDSYGWNAAGNAEDAAKGIYWFIVGEAPTTKPENAPAAAAFNSTPNDMSSILNLMVPAGSIEDTIRTQGSYIIRYQKNPAQVLDVYFCEIDGDYPHTFKPEEYSTLFAGGSQNEYKTNARSRRNYGPTRAVIGYYGGTASVNVPLGNELKSPVLYLNEGNILSVTVSDPNPSTEPHNLYITFSGETSGKDVTIPLLVQTIGGTTSVTVDSTMITDPKLNYIKENIGNIIKYDKDNGTFTFILDDITTPGLHFAEIFQGTGLIPGEKINIQAEANNTEAFTNVAKSNIVSTYVLFDDINKDTGEIEVSNIRQLENLDPDISGFDPAVLNINPTGGNSIDVHQTDSIDFDDFLDDIRNEKGLDDDDPVYIFEIGDTLSDIASETNPDGIQPNTFNPIDPDYHMDYDGENNTISNVVIDTDGDAGLFGSLIEPDGTPADHVSIKDVELVDFDVKSSDGNAGTLAGTLTNANIEGVLVRNTSTDPNHGVTAGSSDSGKDGNAGGLVGEMNGGFAKLCAASTFVQSLSKAASSTNDGNAGGLIGKVTGTISINNCYAGGHTKDAKYLKPTDLNYDATARINVMGNNSAGGFIGNAQEGGTTLNARYCYTTCSVMGATGDHNATGGFIGTASPSTTVRNSYAVGKVFPSTKSGTVYQYAATGSVSPFTGAVHNSDYSAATGYAANYSDNGYLMGVCDSTKNDSTATSYSSKDYDAVGTFVRNESARKSATTYDKTLTARFNGKYTFATLNQLNPGLTGLTGVSKKLASAHFGDWQLPNITALRGKLTNEDTLYFEFQLEDSTREAVMAITGENSGKTRLLLFTIEEDGSVALSGMNSVTNATVAPEIGDIAGAWDTTAAKLAKFEWTVNEHSSIDSTKKSITVVLDDITEPNLHFYDMFGDLLTPGEDISIRSASGQASWGEICNMLDPDGDGLAKAFKSNSIFARGVEDRNTFGADTLTADITHVRHLQNLVANVSSIDDDDDASPKFTKAVMYDDAVWNDTIYDKIYKKDNTNYVEKSFVGIYNPNIEEFDGQNHIISKLVIDSSASGYNTIATIDSSASGYNTIATIDSGAAGLFRTIDQDLAIKNVSMEDCKVNGSYAGGYVGFVRGSKQYTVDFDTAFFIGANASVDGSIHTGGFIGTEENGLGVTINNCAVSAPIHGANYVGGFIGYAQGNVTITKSYVGGQTKGGVYQATTSSTPTQANYNIFSSHSSTSNAGGFIGRIKSINSTDKLTIKNSFSAASVGTAYCDVTKGQFFAGGIVGDLSINADMDNVYTVAPVSRVKVNASSPASNSGAFIGQVYGKTTLTNCFYLPAIYNDVTIDSDTNVAKDLVLFARGQSNVTGTVQIAYYSDDSNTIAAKSDKANSMQQKTNVYDSTLKRENMTYVGSDGKTHTLGTREYPFSIWTTFNGKRTYYGDWQPVLNESTVILYVQFAYDQPNSDGITYTTIDYTTTDGRQEIFKGQDNTLNTPRVKTFANYNFVGWRFYGDDTITYLQPKNRTQITIPKAYCNNEETLKYNPEGGDPSSIRLIATYAKDPDYAIEFVYDGSLASYDPDYTGGTSSINYTTIKILYSDPVETSENHLSYNQLAVPKLDIPGYTFFGWYYDKACTQKINFASTDPITEDITCYAKYERITFIEITVNFMYLAEGSTTETSMGLQPIALELVRDGKSTTQTVALDSSLAGLKLESIKYINGEGQLVPVGGSVTASIADNKLTFTTADSTEFYVTFSGTNSSLKEYEYKIIHRLYNTDSHGNYSSSKTDVYNKEISGTFKAIEGSFTNAPIDAEEGFLLPTAQDVYNIIITSDVSQNVVFIDYNRKPGFITFNSMGGTYVDLKTLTSGENLITSVGSPAPTSTRTGYTLDGWAVHDLGDASTVKEYSWINGDSLKHTMPANNLEAVAQWTPTQTTYTVTFWYEDSDSQDLNNKANYTYAGSIQRTAKTGTQIDGADAKNYFGYTNTSGSSHTHSTACYSGTTTQQVTTKIDRNWQTTYYIGSQIISLSNTSTGNGKVVGYKEGTSISGTPTGKLICVNNTWYVYTGATVIGQTAPCEYVVTDTSWIDKNHFSYNNYLTQHNVKVQGDGSTVVNVYFYRNLYTLYFYWNKTGSSFTHTHNDDCYTFMCGNEHTEHTPECMSCTKTEHTHDGTNCDYSQCEKKEHVHNGTDCDYSECTKPIHTHGDGNCVFSSSCPQHEEHTHTDACGTTHCSHKHTGACLGKNKITNPKNDAITAFNETFAVGGALPRGYIYRFYCQGTKHDNAEGYFFYDSEGKWYKVDDSYCQDGSGIEKTSTNLSHSVSSNHDKVTQYSVKPSKYTCRHDHTDACYDCGKIAHTHTTSCYLCEEHTHNSSCCKIEAHTHGSGCCSIEEHTHTEACYQNCPYGGVHVHTDDCQKVLTCTEFVPASGETRRNNRNLLGVIRAKYNAPIKNYFPIAGQVTSWKCENTSVYNQPLITIDRMHGENLYFYEDTTPRQYVKTAYYYVESLSGQSGVKDLTKGGVTRHYDEYKRVTHGFNFLTISEEMHPIEGFTKYAATHNGLDASHTELLASTSTTSFYPSNDINYIFYTRNSYGLQYVVNGTNYSKSTYQFEAPLTSADITPTRPSGIPADYIFSGWYKDPELSNKFDFANSTMPAALNNGDTSLVVYGKWMPPKYDVRFFSDDTYATEYTSLRINDIYRDNNIGDSICKSNGELTSNYQPTYTDSSMIFKGWYYKPTPTSDPVPFVAYQGIVGNVNNPANGENDFLYVYAEWQSATSALKSSVTIQFLDEAGHELKGEDGNYLLDRLGEQVKAYTVENIETGTLYSVPARSIPGYFSMQAVGSCAVTDDAERNVIKFNYKKAETWDYNVEYYAVYGNYEGTSNITYDGLNLSSDTITVKIGDTITKNTNLQYCTVLYQTPAGYSNYHLTGYQLEYSTGTNIGNGMAVTISDDTTTTPTVRFYIAPDGSAVDFATYYTTYDGTVKSLIHDYDDGDTFAMPGSGLSARLEYTYRYNVFDDHNNQINAIDAGTYLTDGYIVMIINDGTDHRYLIFADENNNSTLVINRRPVYLTSASNTWAYDGNVHTLDNTATDITVGGDGWAPGEGATYMFTVESFRMERGSTENTFTYKLNSNTKAGNYRISVEYGRLTVE